MNNPGSITTVAYSSEVPYLQSLAVENKELWLKMFTLMVTANSSEVPYLQSIQWNHYQHIRLNLTAYALTILTINLDSNLFFEP